MKINVLYTEEEIQAKIKSLAQEMNKFYNGEEVYVVCALKGAVMFMADLVKSLDMPLKMEFIRLSSYNGGTKSSGIFSLCDNLGIRLNGKNGLIVEDIIDTGLTAKFLLEFLNSNFHTKSTKFCSLLDKKVARVTDVEADYHGFEVGDKFLVGYGLDYDGYYRNLRYIGYVEDLEH